jgi:hypothetical protein
MEHQTVIVNIGRGSEESGRKMSHYRWTDFTDELLLAVADDIDTIVYTMAHGVGIWEGEVEDSFVVVASMTDTATDTLRQALVILARKYRQDAIALTVGTVELIGGTK